MTEPKVIVQAEDFDTAAIVRELTAGKYDTGAVVTFTGLCRSEGESLTALELEHYPGMTESALGTIVDNAMSRWDINRVTVIHRVGKLMLNQKIVFVGVTSPHRGSSFEACEFIMDFLKTQAPFWKKEFTDTSEYWLDAQEKDQVAAERWYNN